MPDFHCSKCLSTLLNLLNMKWEWAASFPHSVMPVNQAFFKASSFTESLRNFTAHNRDFPAAWKGEAGLQKALSVIGWRYWCFCNSFFSSGNPITCQLRQLAATLVLGVRKYYGTKFFLHAICNKQIFPENKTEDNHWLSCSSNEIVIRIIKF